MAFARGGNGELRPKHLTQPLNLAPRRSQFILRIDSQELFHSERHALFDFVRREGTVPESDFIDDTGPRFARPGAYLNLARRPLQARQDC